MYRFCRAAPSIKIFKGDPRSVIDYVLDGNELGPEIIMAIKSTPLYNEYGTVGFQPRKKVLRSYNGPKELIPGEGQPSFWNIIHHFPDVARINLFLFANAHLSHYCCQYEANETSIQLLKETFSNTSSEAKTIEQLLKEETMHILTDAKPSLSTWMFFSGYMRATTTIYTQACGDPIHISACPCLEGDRQVYNFFQDKGETVYPLSPRSLWFANNLNTRRVVDEVEVSTSTDGPVGTLPGISHDDRNISRYGYIVYPDDIDRIKNGDWLDDSVINLCIRHLIEGHESSIQMLDSTFARKLMVPKQATCLDDGSRLKFCTLNAEEGMIYTRRLAIQQLELIIIPICDNLHWFTVYLWPRQRKLQYICSMGGRNAKILNLLRTFFCEIMKIKESDISLEFPLVPKQQNGNDCGVFVILYANSMIKKGHMTVEGQGQRQQVLDILKEIRQLCDYIATFWMSPW